MKIVCILPQLSQPRCIKRIKALEKAGFEVAVYGFDNGYYSDNIKDYTCKVVCVKTDDDKSKLSKIKSNINLVRRATENLSKDDVVYLFGIQLAGYYKLIGCRNKYIYEQADLNYTKLNRPLLVSIFRELDKWLIKGSYKTVLTSGGFIDYLYNGVAPNNVCLLENKLHISLKKIDVKDKSISPNLRFGFVGAIRYPRTIFGFANVIASKFPQYEFHFYGEGDSSLQAKELCDKFSNLHYHGKFRNPDDLQSIYENLDVNIVCYDPVSMNVRIAEPNKLYESTFFKVPIVVSEGTFLEKRVKEFHAGFSINALDESAITKFVSSLTVEKLQEVVLQMKQYDMNNLFDQTESFALSLRNSVL